LQQSNTQFYFQTESGGNETLKSLIIVVEQSEITLPAAVKPTQIKVLFYFTQTAGDAEVHRFS
jgi:hypothetical protein